MLPAPLLLPLLFEPPRELLLLDPPPLLLDPFFFDEPPPEDDDLPRSLCSLLAAIHVTSEITHCNCATSTLRAAEYRRGHGICGNACRCRG
jgi:hypothetical protein